MVSSPDPGRSRPLRVAGLALLGVAVGAALVGVVSLAGDGDNGAAPGDTTTPTGGTTRPADSTAPGDTTATGGPTTGDTGTSPAATTQPPPSPSQAPPAPPAASTASPAPPAQTEPRAPLRVYNNSTISGLAGEAAEHFRAAGWVVEEVANYSAGIIPTSTVYFRPGTDEEAPARALASRFNLRVEPRFEGLAGARPGVIVIVTSDYGSK